MSKDRVLEIDIDTEGSKRNKVFRAVQKYFQEIGGDLINVCTFGTEKSKSALRTAARGLNIDDDIISFIVSLVPNERGFDWTLSQCMIGDDDHAPIKRFKDEIDNVPGLWDLASKIEGLITRLGVHASGVIAFNESFTKHNSLMKTTRGVVVSAFNLEDTEYMGGLKYDFLTINALDKIRTAMNLLLEDGIMDWVGDLRSTYDQYLLPKNLDYSSPDMWDMVYRGDIVDLFQFDTAVGSQAVRKIKPENIAQLSVANSVMRLMAQGENAELPLDTYARFKNDIQEWYSEMSAYGLSDDEIKILEKHLIPLSGVADSQESAMMMVMDDKISGFTVTEANSLRKAIAKKKFDVMEKTKEMFYEKGLAMGTRRNLLDYVWEVQVHRQAGYSFSALHTMGYSTVALQEMNLAYKFPIIYWNTACLSVNAGAVNEEDYESLIEDGIVEVEEDEENKRESSKIQYGKVAAAISKFRDELGLRIKTPDVNKSRFGFTPDADNNMVVYGLKGISRVGDAIIREIIANRPYTSLNNFLEKLNSGDRKVISKDKVIMLIKAGAFDDIESVSREEILKNYVRSVADQKKRITLQNMAMLVEKGLIPDEYDFQKKIYNFTKYLRKHKVDGILYELDEVAESFYYENYGHANRYSSSKGDITAVKIKEWDKIYDFEMDKIRAYMSKNHGYLLNELNSQLFNEEYEKYGSGNKLSWEIESINLYHSGHELENIDETFPIEISKLNKIAEDEIVDYFNIKKKDEKTKKWETIVVPKYNIHHIIGTVLDKDKMKHTVVLSTPEGVVTVKLFRNQFAKFDQVVSSVDEDGNKVTIQDSFFKKGTFILVTGIKRSDMFVPKVYKDMDIEPILMFEVENNKFKKAYKKLGD